MHTFMNIYVLDWRRGVYIELVAGVTQKLKTVTGVHRLWIYTKRTPPHHTTVTAG